MNTANYYRMTYESLIKHLEKMEREKTELSQKLTTANEQIKKQGRVIESLKGENDHAKLMKSIEEVKSLVARIEKKYCGDEVTV